MNLRSISIKTDLIFARAVGEVVEREHYLVIRTPSNPGYHWGNYLVFAEPPQDGDEKRWLDIFKKEFSDLASVRHVALTWDTPDPGECVDLFVAEGFAFESSEVLATAQIHPPKKCHTDVEIKIISTDQEWNAVVQEQIMMNDKYDPVGFANFKRLQMANYRKMSLAGLGHWFGAFLEGRLVADLGVFFEGDVARFQQVVTHTDYRRQGICGRLVFEAAKYALDHFGVEKLVMVADANYHAAKIYESVGFEVVDHAYTLSWWRD